MPAGLEDASDRHDEARHPGAVLLAVDSSGSMRAPVGRDGPSRLEVGIQAVERALDQLGLRDAVGVWTFAGQGHAERVPMTKGDRLSHPDVGQKLRQVAPDGTTPLYDTIFAGLAEIGKYGTQEPTAPLRALVVLTDGQDSGRTSVGAAAARVQELTQDPAAPRLFIVATGQASCAGTNGLHQLTDAARGTCYETELSQVSQTMAALFESLWKGQ